MFRSQEVKIKKTKPPKSIYTYDWNMTANTTRYGLHYSNAALGPALLQLMHAWMKGFGLAHLDKGVAPDLDALSDIQST